MSAAPQSTRSARARLPLVRWLRKGRFAIVFFVALVCVGVTQIRDRRGQFWFDRLPAVQRWEAQAYDLRFRSRGNEPANPQIVIAGITSGSLDQKGLEPDVATSPAIAAMHASTWPWPREIHAMVIERLFEAGARMVAVDIVFAAEREGDDRLASVLAKYRDRVVLASVVQDTPNGLTFLAPNELLRTALNDPNAVGFAKVSPDPVDGIVRHFSYRTSELYEFGWDDDGEDLQGFPALAVARFTGGTVPSGKNELINYQGPASTYPMVPVEMIFVPKLFEQGPRFQQGQIFKDKLVFYGPIAEIMHDVHATPFGRMPGVEIHAQVAGSLLDQRLLDGAAHGISFAVTLVSGLIAALAVVLVRNAVWQALVMVGLAATLWIGTQWGFVQGRTIFPVVPALFCLVATGGFGMVFLFLLEQWEKAQTRKVLDRSVNKRIAKVMMQNAEQFAHARRGERRAVAVLFSDIRSFTTWSEQAEPEHLVGQLNEYFERMVELIEREVSLGNAQKFIGDAILAAWGDTPENRFGDAEDSRRAVAVALQMRAALVELNAGWVGRPDRIPISIGIGINIGQVVVGEVGHPDRREYTVLGDGVNFAARLESATKQFHTDCLVGEQVEVLTRDHFVYRHVDYLRVKGKKKPVNVYCLLGDRAAGAPPWLDDYHHARALYVERRFPEAIALFEGVKARIGGEDFLCDMYIERCARFQEEPPPADWDGSYSLTDK
jgi:adenylate cyclase